MLCGSEDGEGGENRGLHFNVFNKRLRVEKVEIVLLVRASIPPKIALAASPIHSRGREDPSSTKSPN